jgi:hypothetical protein
MRKSMTFAAALAIGLAASAAGADQGSALLDSKQDGTLVLSGREFRWNDGTALEDEEGNRIGFAELPSRERGASDDDAAVWYEASDDEASPLLYRLKLTGAVPR